MKTSVRYPVLAQYDDSTHRYDPTSRQIVYQSPSQGTLALARVIYWSYGFVIVLMIVAALVAARGL